jgi:hypothetical protein
MRDALRLETKLPVTQTVNVRIGRENSLTVRLGRSVWEDSLHPSGKTAFAGTSGKTQTAGKTAFVQFARGRGRQDDKTALAPCSPGPPANPSQDSLGSLLPARFQSRQPSSKADAESELLNQTAFDHRG